MSRQLKLLDLPEEVLLHILDFVYQPWCIRIRMREDILIEDYYYEAVFQAIPDFPEPALLLTCKCTHRLAQNKILHSYTGTVDSLDTLPLKKLPEKWKIVASLVTRLCLPVGRFVLLESHMFILSLPSIKLVELWEHQELSFTLDKSSGPMGWDIFAIPEEDLRAEARVCIPRIPRCVPFKCYGGHVELLLHCNFVLSPTDSSPAFSVIFGIGPNFAMEIISREMGPTRRTNAIS